MQHNQKSCVQEEVSILATGRELMEEELAIVYGGGQGDPASTDSSALGGLLSGGTLGNLANSSGSNGNGLSPLTSMLKNALPGLGGLSNLSQLLSGLGL